ncbi:MAG: HlyD family efflux transporter periplasmic adaptor subunit [Clostridium sp.]|nr:HlyD family efflux transporter periplasmic adaptor subunit [Clostridium sp.]
MEKETNRKHIVKKAAVIFLVAMLILTFFSNTIMNYSLPEVATEPVTTGTVSNKVRGQGTVETNSDLDVTVSGARVVKEVKVEVGDEVKKGDVLFTFEEGENTELDEAQNALDDLELNYAKSLLKSAPDYTEDNISIKDAKEDLQNAIDAQETAAKNDKTLKAAKKEAAEIKKKVAAAQAKVDSLQEQSDAYSAAGDYDAINDQLKADNESLAAMKVQLSDLKEDLKKAQDAGEDTTDLNRQIRDKETDIANKQDDISSGTRKLEALKPSKQVKSDLASATKTLTSLQKQQEEKEAKVTELSAASTLADAKAAVKEKRKALASLIRGLDTKKKEDSLNAQLEALDNEAAQKSIEEQRDKVDKIKNSNDITEVKAEEDGIVSEVNCKTGDSVTADAPLAKIQLADSGYVVKVTVTKAQSKLIRTGDEATVENVWDDSVTATVKSIRADTENPNQNMIVTFEVKGDGVSVGQTLAFAVGNRSSQYDAVVPNNAVREDSKGKFVLVLKVKGTPLGNRYTVKRADVEVQASDDTSSGVTGGVYENDNVITNSSKPLEEGMQVRLVE